MDVWYDLRPLLDQELNPARIDDVELREHDERHGQELRLLLRAGPTEAGMIRLYRWNIKENHGCWVEARELQQKKEELRAADVLWIDLENPTPEEETLVFQQFFPIHFLSFEDVTRLRRIPDRPPHLPKVEEFPDYLFVIVNPLQQRVAEGLCDGRDPVLPEGTATTQLSAVLTHSLLLTHHYEPLASVTE